MPARLYFVLTHLFHGVGAKLGIPSDAVLPGGFASGTLVQGGPACSFAAPAMSYYGLPPTKFANEYNEFEKLLRALPLDGAIKALDLLETITRNTAQNPQDEKFRRVRTTNEKLSALFGLPGIIPVMECMGWQQDGEFLQLPKSVKLDFPQHVVKILEAKSHFGKLQESEKRAAKLAQDPNKAELLKQLELDRRERGSAPKPEAPAAVQAMSEEEQLQAALKLSMETASATASTTEGQSEGSSPK
ncbi:hypothetical protein AK812_SmicGene45289, partial [Symbiodinium microadriaticum]